MTLRSWDIFCTVIDNYGDIGVCWRLARQLAQEHGHAVRLWVDDLASFARMAPSLSPSRPVQRLAGVEVRHWRGDADTVGVAPHDVVVEAFACNVPEPFVLAMTQAPRTPVWINLEYLSAEPWVREHHGMASPHPRLPLTKYFFFPGFEFGTGGVLREAMLGGRRRDFAAATAGQARLWHRLGVQPWPDSLRVSLFAYGNRSLPPLLTQWRNGDERIHCLVPSGPAAEQAFEWVQRQPDVQAGTGTDGGRQVTTGKLRLAQVPFLPQDGYDELLWLCDVNFVRGEDSFVRAQWAARPFVWHIYPQDEDTHRAKLDAFLALYLQTLRDAGVAQALQTFWRAWNGFSPGASAAEGDSRNDSTAAAAAWPAFRAALPALTRAAARWEQGVAGLGDLAANLVAFCETRVK
ncbi:elongation factor P maturation arginine rhamnosyltransferase EarP [Cupriavidus sp. AU9028]|uniref:elongation factor P maturation arginine rhamnosyltransferase EarP n=1 Tax=Cupriavidus sp. AU9028 TaxID=2871157 RepID=UPI001C94CB6A|nr:elongation factor P maturation arginine rhamnosyltransferase EarP [Cupriavidus sp. AU9028]MBY4896326.1 elongation factor P maturation arginine rhamnosyltransferase EarP [Cupriavidus sp. AU9028]